MRKGKITPTSFLSRWFAATVGLVSLCQAEEIDFGNEVLPLLSENCFQCHGPDAAERKADLRLDNYEGALAVLDPENPGSSALLTRIHSTDPGELMPPPETGKTLTPAQQLTLRRWIESGANYETHWAFEPIVEPVLPKATGDPAGTEIDRFLLAALEEHDLSLSPPATKSQLIRRATFDLTGLPPGWEEVEEFLGDSSPDAFARVIDRLLASPAYGERWGRHWLDLARYADTHGGSAIGFTRFAFSYTYRDYVINAFNADLPYDRFLLEQLAADQLKLDENDPALAGLGFLTVGRQYRNEHDRLDDQIDVISRGLLGLTVSCARCHDHKFDPIPTKDYYSLHAALADSRVPEEFPLIGNPTIAESYQTELKKREDRRDDLVREHGEVFRGRLRMQVGRYLKELASGVPEQDTSTTFLSYRTEDLRPVILERWRAYLKDLEETDPVFGPWHRAAKLEADTFPKAFAAVIGKMVEENGDPGEFASDHRLSTKPPRWNPRVLDAMASRNPKSFVEVAEVYGEVFALAHREWLTSLLEASIEASPDGTLVEDQDPKHRIINSPIHRQLRHHLYGPDTPTMVPLVEGRNLMMLNRGVRDTVRGSVNAIHNLNLGATAPPRARVLEESPERNPESYVFLRGNPVQRGEKVKPAFLSILSETNAPPFSPGTQRLDLARAIVAPENPLTRRVIVNWIWQHHFGHGLVRTPDDFGTRGDPPSHPELLDFLANRLLEDNWSLKKMHRRIMLSAAYRQASIENADSREKDPLNDLLWRMPTRRLEMESMRDAMLAVSGELDLTRGGQPFEETDTRVVPRRSVYAFLNRDVISPLVSTFDGADPSACTVQRQETMVPQQTLFALNSNFIRDRAIALSQLPEVQAAESDEERLRLIYQRVYSRPPGPGELALAKDYLTDKDAWPQLVQALLASNEFHFID
jgi:hypothetical protein